MEHRHETFKKIGLDIAEHARDLKNQVQEIQHADDRFHFSRNDEYFLTLIDELFQTMGRGITDDHPESPELKENIRSWGEKAADYCLKKEISLGTALTIIPQIREVLTNTIERECLEFELSLHDSFVIYSTFESLLDNAAHAFSHTFVNHHIEALERAKQEMQEISVPVVPITQGTAVLPLIGDMDDERSEFLQERTLERATELELSYLIIDLSGINTINTWFAQHLNQMIEALQLLGIDTSISGMRPELSQTIVHLGINFKHVAKYLTLEQALQQHTAYFSL
ncbi:STAS domain-containing protein [Salibacterium halotolerans]|uniref:RsbT co-antagonist protein RsbR n=1 Tax=Salibacterium halotolerans TaxID=1884432 RepID=A0A1I5XEA3_9BACI|nr:STAS domain-containing protein [Salibacterium halotolerans]SFQ30312.1 rsbT co-antagonist protein RsbR [Salibacterium halotolerans]